MLIKDSLDEMKKREVSLKVIKSIIDNDGRDYLYDLTGLSGGFLATEEDLNLLETYIGPAIFEEKLQILGKEHLGGEKIFAVNRTSSGILATILTIAKEDSYVVHFLPEFPAHPSIPRSASLVGANYLEFEDINKFIANFPENTSLVVITPSTMDHKILDEEEFKTTIDLAKDKNIPVLVDDASGARLRTAIFSQKKATELGADLVVTSTDKLMMGPRGGLMAGKEDLIDEIKTKSHQFGLEAQPPSILAMVKGLENYNENDLKKSLAKKDELMDLLANDFEMFEKTPTGIMVSENNLKDEIIFSLKKDKSNFNETSLDKFSNKDFCFIWAMLLLKEEHIVTIPAVSMPGASATVRFDLAANDVDRMDIDILYKRINNSFKKLLNVLKSEKIAKNILFSFN
ncbi:MAG: TIGR03576 family pyridoxal phosphate-dependent enzyme [Methanobrevibacter sp.]|nr:TIGR03576 family pyridoxal phosphate-dependent enzyme [Methanobrevibacter sp.]